MDQILEYMTEFPERDPYSILKKFSIVQLADLSFTPLWRANRHKVNAVFVEFVNHCRLWRGTKTCRKLQFPNCQC